MSSRKRPKKMCPGLHISVANLHNLLTARKLYFVCFSAHMSQIQRRKRDMILNCHYLLFDFKVVLGPDIDKLSDRVSSR